MSGGWMFVVALWALSLALVRHGTRPLGRVDVERWADRFSVPLDGDVVAGFLQSRLRRARAIRTGGLVLGLNLSMLPMYWNVIDVERASSSANDAVESAVLVGPTIGALIAELLVVQRPLEGRADLVRRRPSDYIDQAWLWAIATMSVAGVGGAIIATLRASWRWQWTWVAAGIAVLALAAATYGVRAVIARPLMVADGPLRVADEGLRASGVHCIVGAAVALGSFGVMNSVGRAADSGAVWIPLIMLRYMSLGVWWQLAARAPWSVERARRSTGDRVLA